MRKVNAISMEKAQRHAVTKADIAHRGANRATYYQADEKNGQ